MEFPDLHQKKTNLIDNFSREEGVAADKVRVIASPYRICPLGAHIDHQGGPVLGMTINACTLMAFYPSKDGCIRLRSKNYPDDVTFDVRVLPDSPGKSWGVYPWAAAKALQEKYEIERGVVGHLDGMLPGCGLSSSASVLLAYIYALAAANSLDLKPWDYVHLTRRAENKYIGLSNGILDQSSIVFGRRGYLLQIDTRGEKVRHLPDRLGENHYRIIVAYSGYSRELTTSGYNSRVDECRVAAEQLSRMAGKSPAKMLSDVSPGEHTRFNSQLEASIGRRANHFFSESQRVLDGVVAWEDGNIEKFGQLMNDSCKSSIEKYECGVQAVCDLQHIVSSADGVLGSRFMGGGFGGCVVGFIRPSHAAAAVEAIKDAYQKLHPQVADHAAVYLARADDGVRFI